MLAGTAYLGLQAFAYAVIARTDTPATAVTIVFWATIAASCPLAIWVGIGPTTGLIVGPVAAFLVVGAIVPANSHGWPELWFLSAMMFAAFELVVAALSTGIARGVQRRSRRQAQH